MSKFSSLAFVAGTLCISPLISSWLVSPNGTAHASSSTGWQRRAASKEDRMGIGFANHRQMGTRDRPGNSKETAEARFEWISTNPYHSSEAVARQSDGGLRRSTDGGESWEAISAPEGSSSARVVFALPSQANSEEEQISVIYLYSNQVWRSEDSGQSWRLIYAASENAKVLKVASLDSLPGSALLMLSDGRVLTTLDAATATSGFGWTVLPLPDLKGQEEKALTCASREYCYAAFAGSQETRLFKILTAIGQFDEVALPGELSKVSSKIRLEVHPEHPEEILLASGVALWSSSRNSETDLINWKHEFDSESAIEEIHVEMGSDHDSFTVLAGREVVSATASSSCSITFREPANIPASASAGTDDVYVKASSSRCSWTASLAGPDPFLAVSKSKNGPFGRTSSDTGSGRLYYTFKANGSNGGRINDIVIGSARFPVRQDPQVVSISGPNSVTIDRGKTSFSILVSSNGGYRVIMPSSIQTVTSNGTPLTRSPTLGSSWAFGNTTLNFAIKPGRMVSGFIEIRARSTAGFVLLNVK